MTDAEQIPASGAQAPIARLSDDEIFPPADYQHRLRLKRGSAESFFQPWPAETDLLDERQRWIREFPERHALASEPATQPLLEFARFAAKHLGIPTLPALRTPHEITAFLGGHLEPDFAILTANPEGGTHSERPPVSTERGPASGGSRPQITATSSSLPLPHASGPELVAASVCFPSSWCPEEKLGARMDAIHAVVPELNAELGSAIGTFLERLKPGAAWMRANWGLSASNELNQHPARRLPRLQPPLDPSAVWVRIEHQLLFVLPETKAVVFGIRIDSRRLDAFRTSTPHAAALSQALDSMPEPMAVYKGLASVRSDIVQFLRSPGPGM